MSKDKLIPELRFPEFVNEGEWVEKTIGEFAPLQRGFDLPIDTITIGKYPVVFSNGISKFHNEFKVKGPGIVTGRSGTIGKVTYVEVDFWPHNTSLWVTDFNGNFPLFVFYYFGFIGLEQFGTGSGVPTLNRNDVHRHRILVPHIIKEQQKIASCLSSLDEVIAAQTQKLDLLKDHKKGLMQNLFPQEGETVPKVRFKEFERDGDWVEKTIEEIAKVTTGNKDTQNKVEDGLYPFFVRSQTVERINSYSFDGEAILTSGDGVGVGKNFHYIIGKFDYHQRVYCIYDFKSDISGQFVYMYFSQHFNERVMKMSAKNSVDSVRMAMITEMPICLPSKKEQQKIASLLSSLDALITAQSELIAQLKLHKKGLMQGLFPKIN